MKIELRVFLPVILTVFIFSGLFGEEYYVSPDGSDNNPGTIGKPFKTLEYVSGILKPGDTCYIRKGIYREVLRPVMSGTEGAEITYCSYENEEVFLTGTDTVADWTIDEGNVYKATMDWTLSDGNQIFINGEILHEASWPEAGDEPFFNPGRAIVAKGSVETITNMDIPGTEEDWIGADLWCTGGFAWFGWSSKITGFDKEKGTLYFSLIDWLSNKYYRPKYGNKFILRGSKKALQNPGQWYYDSDKKQLLIIPPNGVDLNKVTVEAKRRNDVIDLSNRSNITVKGLDFYSGGITTNENSLKLTFHNLTGVYVSHSYTRDTSEESGVFIMGRKNLVLSCDFGYSSGSVVTIKGEDHKIINNYIHHGNYTGWNNGTVALSGRRILFSHNTVYHSGRDVVTTFNLMESLVQYNDIAYAGRLTKDLGIIYGHNTDYANTVFRNNWIHDNLAESEPVLAVGIYFDIGNQNAIVKNNLVWNIPGSPINFNNPSYNSLVLNNSCYNTGALQTFDYFDRNDMYNSRFTNNIFNKKASLPSHVFFKNNLLRNNPKYKNVNSGDFRLERSSETGAYSKSDEYWKAGCNFTFPPNPLPVYEKADIPWMNGVYNAAFEFGSLEGWIKTHSKKAKLVEGNNWGNDWGSKNLHKTATYLYELELSGGKDGVQQVIRNLNPDTSYTLSAWLRVSDSKESVTLGVKDFGNTEVRKSSSSRKWKRKVIKFKTGPASSEATVYIVKSEGTGLAWCDNVGLPLTPEGK